MTMPAAPQYRYCCRSHAPGPHLSHRCCVHGGCVIDMHVAGAIRLGDIHHQVPVILTCSHKHRKSTSGTENCSLKERCPAQLPLPHSHSSKRHGPHEKQSLKTSFYPKCTCFSTQQKHQACICDPEARTVTAVGPETSATVMRTCAELR